MNARTLAPEAAVAVAGPLPAPAKPARPLRRVLLMVSVPVLLAAGVGGWWLSGAHQESTEDAYLHQARI